METGHSNRQLMLSLEIIGLGLSWCMRDVSQSHFGGNGLAIV